MAKAKEESTALTSMSDRIASRLANINETTQAPSSNKISLSNKKFKLPDGNTSNGPLNCIIVDYVNTNSFYKEAFDANNIAPPDCFAQGRDLKSLLPDTSIESPISTKCDGCAYNEFGSKGAGKMCSNGVKLVVLPEDFNSDSDMYTVNISATGLKRWAEYVRALAGRALDPVQVVTSLSFDDNVSYPSLKFKPLNDTPDLESINPFISKADALLSGN